MLGSPVRHFDAIDSTNNAALEWARAGAPHGAMVTADAQTGGRGRRGRSWNSPPGRGVYLSVVTRPPLEAHQVPQLTILAALAGARAVEACAEVRTQTKWPNDLLLDDRKIGGILCESALRQNATAAVDFVVIGIGLNVNFELDDLPPRPVFPATSLLIETGRTFSIETVRDALLSELNALWERHAAGEWPALREEFSSRCRGLGQWVTVATESGPLRGIATRIDDDGILEVQTESGPQKILAGDVTY